MSLSQQTSHLSNCCCPGSSNGFVGFKSLEFGFVATNSGICRDRVCLCRDNVIVAMILDSGIAKIFKISRCPGQRHCKNF